MKRALALLSAAALTMSPTSLSANSSNNLRYEWVFYDDAYSEVGRYYVHCDGQTFMTGEWTNRVQVIEHFCPE